MQAKPRKPFETISRWLESRGWEIHDVDNGVGEPITVSDKYPGFISLGAAAHIEMDKDILEYLKTDMPKTKYKCPSCGKVVEYTVTDNGYWPECAHSKTSKATFPCSSTDEPDQYDVFKMSEVTT